jgi:uncharacterized SAM-binding protein YcdF (DUF218 family)
MKSSGKKKKTWSRTRKALNSVVHALFVLFLAYLTFVFLYRLFSAKEAARITVVFRFVMELVVYGVFALVVVDMMQDIFTWEKNRTLSLIGMVLRLLCVLICAVYIMLMGIIARPNLEDTTEESDYVLVLGQALENGRASGDLARRLEKAIEVEQENPDSIFIFSGGNDPDIENTEATVMLNYFVAHGGDIDRTLEETESTDTVQNVRNLGRMVDNTTPVSVITSDYHMLRTAGILKKQGWTAVRYIPADSDNLFFGENQFWEAICVLHGTLRRTMVLF